jgi:hypothetical protein
MITVTTTVTVPAAKVTSSVPSGGTYNRARKARARAFVA